MDTVFKKINYKEGFYEVVCKTARTESDIVNVALLRENVDGVEQGLGRAETQWALYSMLVERCCVTDFRGSPHTCLCVLV